MARTNISNAFLLAAIMLLSNPLSAQSNASKQPLPTFNNNGRWASSNGNVCSSIFFSQTMNMCLGSGRILSACCCFKPAQWPQPAEGGNSTGSAVRKVVKIIPYKNNNMV